MMQNYRVEGTLAWNEFEGGFWSLQLDAAHPELGSDTISLGQPDTMPAGASDGVRLRATVAYDPGTIGFLMAGPQAELVEAELVDPA